MFTLPDNGMEHHGSPYTAAETMQRLKNAVTAKGIPILAHIDHSGDAAKAGLKMPPAELLIFGNAKAGTPLMLASPTIAIDLPLKVLVWEDPDGKVWASYNSLEYLRQRHHLPESLLSNLAVIRILVEEAAMPKQ
jgi:uncharacterized protein (DUF302 family)